LGAGIGIGLGGTFVSGLYGTIIASGIFTFSPYAYLNIGKSVGPAYRAFNIHLPENFLFEWFFFGSTYGGLESVWDQYKVNVAYALTSSSHTNPQNKDNIENKIARIYVETVKMNAGSGTGSWSQSILYKFNYFGASFAPNCNLYARKVAFDLAQQLNLQSEPDWKVELVLNSKKYGSTMPQAGMHSFVVLSYKGHRRWVLDPWSKNLPEIYDYDSFVDVWPPETAIVSVVNDPNSISLDYD
jgi:hypothetical protein